jgi:hypothetical protein
MCFESLSGMGRMNVVKISVGYADASSIGNVLSSLTAICAWLPHGESPHGLVI